MTVVLFSAFFHGIKFRIFVAGVQNWTPQTYLYKAQNCIQYTSCSVELNIGQRDDYHVTFQIMGQFLVAIFVFLSL